MVYRTGGGVLYGQHAKLGFPALHRTKHVLEGGEEVDGGMAKHAIAGYLLICALHALAGNVRAQREECRAVPERLLDALGGVALAAQRLVLRLSRRLHEHRLDDGGVARVLRRHAAARGRDVLALARAVVDGLPRGALVLGHLGRDLQTLHEELGYVVVYAIDLLANLREFPHGWHQSSDGR